MAIKDSSDWYFNEPNKVRDAFEIKHMPWTIEAAYDAGVAEAKKHYEEEKIAIHEYYDKRIRELMGSPEKEPADESNNGRLT